ncbi:hypothetical protein FHR20_001324 [Sphingomonas leidyi]|uniref:Uncharacterized protein n=1 Tax=Sphingomonas leidyi TaxID=68569 RepID=A0A7X5ZVG4_9SPHN|nr:hypothetical protein [Sphingomonas leidyi]NIJ64393.1 hypothetical protein [Sphingomonas leidyi]
MHEIANTYAERSDGDGVAPPAALAPDPAPHAKPLSDLEIYNVFRDYIKHEDGLMNTRLSSFLSMNSFLIGFSVLVLGGMLSAASRMRPDTKLLALLALGTLVHAILAYIGYDAARLTRSSIQAATDSLKILREKGNIRLAAPIARGDFPHLTDARELSDREKAALERGSGIMRGFPRHMQRMWFIMGTTPVLVTGLAAYLWFGTAYLAYF